MTDLPGDASVNFEKLSVFETAPIGRNQLPTVKTLVP